MPLPPSGRATPSKSVNAAARLARRSAGLPRGPTGSPGLEREIEAGPPRRSMCCQKSPYARSIQARSRQGSEPRRRDHGSRSFRCPRARTTPPPAGATDETRIASPFAYAPSPRAAHQRVARAGADATAATRTPSRSSAISVAQSGIPRTKCFVPSIGSRIQRAEAPSPVRSELLSDDRLARPFARDRRAQRLLRTPVGHRHRRQVGLGLDLQLWRAEVPHRDLVREVGRGRARRRDRRSRPDRMRGFGRAGPRSRGRDRRRRRRLRDPLLADEARLGRRRARRARRPDERLDLPLGGPRRPAAWLAVA